MNPIVVSRNKATNTSWEEKPRGSQEPHQCVVYLIWQCNFGSSLRTLAKNRNKNEVICLPSTGVFLVIGVWSGTTGSSSLVIGVQNSITISCWSLSWFQLFSLKAYSRGCACKGNLRGETLTWASAFRLWDQATLNLHFKLLYFLHPSNITSSGQLRSGLLAKMLPLRS